MHITSQTGDNSILTQQYYVTSVPILKNMKNDVLNIAFCFKAQNTKFSHKSIRHNILQNTKYIIF
jgi:hypothetical protein